MNNIATIVLCQKQIKHQQEFNGYKIAFTSMSFYRKFYAIGDYSVGI